MRGWWCSSGPERGTGCAVLKVQATVMGTGIGTLRLITLQRSGQSIHTFISSRHKATGTKKSSGTQSHLLLVRPPGNTHYGRQQAQTRRFRMICAFSKLCSEGLINQPPRTQLWYLPGLKTQTTAFQSSFLLPLRHLKLKSNYLTIRYAKSLLKYPE